MTKNREESDERLKLLVHLMLTKQKEIVQNFLPNFLLQLNKFLKIQKAPWHDCETERITIYEDCKANLTETENPTGTLYQKLRDPLCCKFTE